VRVSALNVLIALTSERSQLHTIVECTGASQPHGTLPSMVRKSVATLTGHLEDQIYNMPFVESVFSLLTTLAYASGIASLTASGLMASLIPMIRYQHTNLSHIKVPDSNQTNSKHSNLI
jgi:E3 ubiquitin-protein ligase HUWE1